MKKKISLFLFLPLTLALPACNQGPANQEAVNELKTLLSKQDLSPVYTKMFVANFSQNYDVFAKQQDQDAQQTRFYSYLGGGAFGCLYEVSEAAYKEASAQDNYDFFDFLSRGQGSYGLVQSAKVISYHYDSEKQDNGGQTTQNLSYLQQLQAKFAQNDVQVCNVFTLNQGSGNSPSQHFNGVVNKQALFNSISTRALSDIFARTNLYDGQRSCEVLDRIYFDVVKGLTKKTDVELGDFITKNNIVIDNSGENTLVRFKVEEESLRLTLTDHDIIPGILEGALTYEKGSGKFSAFEYKIVHVVSESDATTGNISSASMEFKVNGYSWNKKYGEDLYIDPNPTVYESAEAFLTDMVKEVIPPSI